MARPTTTPLAIFFFFLYISTFFAPAFAQASSGT
jgi:hypothetical protein